MLQKVDFKFEIFPLFFTFFTHTYSATPFDQCEIGVYSNGFSGHDLNHWIDIAIINLGIIKLSNCGVEWHQSTEPL